MVKVRDENFCSMMYSYCFNNVQLLLSFFLPFLEVVVVMKMSHVGVATVLV